MPKPNYTINRTRRLAAAAAEILLHVSHTNLQFKVQCNRQLVAEIKKTNVVCQEQKSLAQLRFVYTISDTAIEASKSCRASVVQLGRASDIFQSPLPHLMSRVVRH